MYSRLELKLILDVPYQQLVVYGIIIILFYDQILAKVSHKTHLLQELSKEAISKLTAYINNG